MLHVMTDIETMGTEPGCGIWQIGAVAIDTHAGVLTDTLFSMTADPSTSTLKADSDTLAWQTTVNYLNWDEANGASATEAQLIKAYLTWAQELEGSKLWWSQGHFDYPILAIAFKLYGLGRAPWTFSRCRDLRTITGWFGGTPIRKPKGLHNATVDTLYQADVLWNFLQTKENYYVRQGE